MKEPSEQDWQLLNGYHDGELPEPQRSALEARLQNEPDLAAALACLRELSAGLGALRPLDAPAAPVAVPAPRRPWRWLAAGALAASLAAAALFFQLRPENPALAVHMAFLQQDFAVDEAMLTSVAAEREAGLPDLGPARLTLVASRRVEGGRAAHYAGVNGCRLTVLDTAAPVPLPTGPDMRTASWQAESRHFGLIATGMDRDRFRAIAAYLKQLTGQGAAPEIRLALADATRKATSCSSGAGERKRDLGRLQ